MRVLIDETRCQGHGRCELIAPAYFVVDDAGVGRVLTDQVAPADRVLRAAELCLVDVDAIRLADA